MTEPKLEKQTCLCSFQCSCLFTPRWKPIQPTLPSRTGHMATQLPYERKFFPIKTARSSMRLLDGAKVCLSKAFTH